MKFPLSQKETIEVSFSDLFNIKPSFEVKKERDSIIIHKGHPVAKIILDEDGIEFSLYDPNRGLQIIMLTIHFLSKYDGIIEKLKGDENNPIWPIAIEE